MGKQKEIPLLNIPIAIRDSRLVKNAEWQLLMAIGLRVNRKDFTCWPSYELLALDTGLHPSTLKKTADKLQKKGLIRRRIRHNHSNVFTLNIDKILRAADANRKADKERKAALAAADTFAVEDTSPLEEEMDECPPQQYTYGDPFGDDQDSL